MKAAIAAVLVTLLFGAATADAAWYPKKRLPKPIDTPIVRGKVKEDHKPNNRQKHPPDYRASLAPVAGAVNA